ncbi:MAG: hypothetical protein RO009_23010 [Pseudorhodoplanes sp.]|jgi:hypothetical protein|nr:hypothetical protein [Pseudorhodoplanes sp.]
MARTTVYTCNASTWTSHEIPRGAIRHGRVVNSIDDAQAVFIARAVKYLVGHRGMVKDLRVTTNLQRTKRQNAQRIIEMTACERTRYGDTPLEGGRSASIEFWLMERERFPWERHNDQ